MEEPHLMLQVIGFMINHKEISLENAYIEENISLRTNICFLEQSFHGVNT